MPLKKKNPNRVKVVSVLVKYNLRKLELEVFGSFNDAEIQKEQEELNGFVCQIVRKQIK